MRKWLFLGENGVWNYFGTILEIFWKHFGSILGCCLVPKPGSMNYWKTLVFDASTALFAVF